MSNYDISEQTGQALGIYEFIDIYNPLLQHQSHLEKWSDLSNLFILSFLPAIHLQQNLRPMRLSHPTSLRVPPLVAIYRWKMSRSLWGIGCCFYTYSLSVPPILLVYSGGHLKLGWTVLNVLRSFHLKPLLLSLPWVFFGHRYRLGTGPIRSARELMLLD